MVTALAAADSRDRGVLGRAGYLSCADRIQLTDWHGPAGAGKRLR